MKRMILALSFTLLLATASAQEKSTIEISKANYGQNCKLNVEQGDYTAEMKQACDGKTNCSFGTIGSKGDLCPGFMKDFDWTWTCTNHEGQRSGHITGEASKKAANAYCPFHDEISMKKKAAKKAAK